MKYHLLLFTGILLFLISFSDAQCQTNKIIEKKLNCAPKDYNPRILNLPASKSIHSSWKESEVGTSWGFISTKKIINKEGEFLYGDLISPRGGIITKSCYVIYKEWECFDLNNKIQ